MADVMIAAAEETLLNFGGSLQVLSPKRVNPNFTLF